MADLLSYRGDPGLGLGSAPGIAPPLGPNDNLKTINDVGRDIMLLDADRNMKIYQNKVDERNKTMELILKNQVNAGEIDPKYYPRYNEAKGDVEKAFDKWGGNFNDQEGYARYQEAVTHLQDVASHAQVNTLELKKLKSARSEETLPWKQKDMDRHIDQEESKPFWGQVDPYQKMFSFSIDPINKLLKTSTTTGFSKDGLWRFDTTHADYKGTLSSAQSEYLNNGETAEDMREWLTQVDGYDPAQKKKFIDSINGQLHKYNGELGLKPGDAAYADEIGLVNGKIQASPVDFSAKYSLAQQEKFSTTTPQFQKDVGTYKIAEEKNRIAWAKLNEVDRPKAQAYVERWTWQKKELSGQEQVGAQKYSDLLDATVNTTDPIYGDRFDIHRINTDQLPESRQFIGGVVYNPTTGKRMLGRLIPYMDFLDEKGNVVKTSKKDKDKYGYDAYELDIKNKKTTLPYNDWLQNKAKDSGLTVQSHYDVKYFRPDGKELTDEKSLPDDLRSAYREFVKKYGGTYDQFIKGLAKRGAINAEFQGQNGTATPQTILEGSKYETSQYGKKGFEGMYSPDDDGNDSGGGESASGSSVTPGGN